MSVAASLAHLRASSSAVPSHRSGPSLPRRDLAGLALNGLDTLSTIDPTFPSLAPSLLLLPPYSDRATLPPQHAHNLSSAVVQLATRLAPVFPLRPAQKLVTWLLHGLRLPYLGHESELDALMLSALPFHATPHFVELCVEVLRSRPCNMWEWLRPVAVQKKPPSVGFIVRDCPDVVLRLALDAAVDAVKSGVNTVAAAAFLANLLIRRLSVKDTSARRALLLAVIDSLDTACRLKVKEQQKHDLLCALLSAIAAAVPVGLEPDVAAAAAQTVAKVMRSAEVKSPSSDTAAACLALLVTRSGVRVLGKEVARGLIADGLLVRVLPRLRDERLTKATYVAVVMGLVTKPGVRVLGFLEKALANDNAVLLSEESVGKMLTRVLDVFSRPSSDKDDMVEEKEDAMLEKFVSLLASLARGRFAAGVDLALREHLNGRKRKKSERARYAFVDAAIARALQGTAFEVVKESVKKPQLPEGRTVLAMLAHPEPSVRKAALARLIDVGNVGNDQTNDVTEKVVEICLELLKNDVNVQVAADAAMCILHAPAQHTPEDLLKSILTRFREAYSLLPKKRKKKKSRLAGVVSLATALISVGERLWDGSTAQVEAGLIGLIIEGTLCDDSVLSGEEELIGRLNSLLSRDSAQLDFVSLCVEGKSFSITETLECALKAKIQDRSWDFEPLVGALAVWEPEWALNVLSLWCSHLGSQTSKTRRTGLTGRILKSLTSLYEDYDSVREKILEVAIKAVKPLCTALGSEPALTKTLDLIWELGALGCDERVCKRVLQEVVAYSGLDNARAMLHRSMFLSPASHHFLRISSLRWFLALCENDSSDDVHREAGLSLTCSFYGNDTQLREEVISLSVVRKAAIGTNVRKPSLDVLWNAIERAGKADAVSAEEETNTVGTANLMRLYLLRLRKRSGYCSPLVSQDLSEELRIVLCHAVKRIVDEKCSIADRLYLLRAVEGFSEFDDENRRGLFHLLTDLLKKLQAPGDAMDLIAEAIIRITLVLVALTPTEVSSRAILTSAKAANSVLQTARLEASSNLCLSPEMQYASVSAATLVFSLCPSTSTEDERQALLGHLLSFSTKASPAGTLAMQVLDLVLLDGNSDKLECFLDSFSRRLEANEVDYEQDNGEDSRSRHMDREAGLGAVEALKRLLTNNAMADTLLKFNMPSIVSSLWTFVRNATTADESNVDEALEYELQNVLSVLSALYRREDLRKRSESLPPDFDALMNTVFYPPLSRQDRDSALKRSVRVESLELLDVLAPVCGGQLVEKLGAVLDGQIGEESFAGALSSVHRLAPILLKGGCEFRRICSLLARAVFSETVDVFLTEKDRLLIASCCMLIPNVEAAVTECIQEISRHATEHRSLSVIAKECSSLLLTMGQSVMTDLSVISKADDDLKCELALVYMLQPKLSLKLAEELRNEASEPAVRNAFTQLLQSLWQSDGNHREKSVEAVVALLPLPALGSCFVHALSRSDSLVRLRALRALSERLDDDMPLSPAWGFEESEVDDTQERRASEAVFIEKVGTTLCDIIAECKNVDLTSDDGRAAQLTSLAMADMRKMTDRIGSSARHVLLKLSATPLKILDDARTPAAISSVDSGEIWCSYIGGALSCFSSMVIVLGKHAVPFIPKVLGVSARILESAFVGANGVPNNDLPLTHRSSVISMTESAVRMCTTVLEHNGKFFGRNMLKSIATMAVATNVNEVNDLLQTATRKAPASVTIGALAAVADNLAESSASLGGVATLSKSVGTVIEVLSKPELKVQKVRLVTTLLTCLEFGRVGGRSSLRVLDDEKTDGRMTNGSRTFEELLLSLGSKGFQSACQVVDERCTEAITRLALRVPESDFQIIFNSVVQWLAGGQLENRADSSTALLVHQKLMRTVPVLRISLSLMKTLQAIFVPYFLPLLDQVLDVVDSKRPDSSSLEAQEPPSKQGMVVDRSNKRKRLEWEREEKEAACEVICRFQSEMYELALDNLVQFLSQDLTSNIMTPAFVSRIQGSLVSACRNEDKSEKVRRAFNALGTRIVATGNKKESKEESRELLIALSRAILTLGGESDAAIREASVHYCKSLASTIGDEYLVSLPEAMPMLSELIDDESDAVRRETNDFVMVLEALSGQSIMEEMKS